MEKEKNDVFESTSGSHVYYEAHDLKFRSLFDNSNIAIYETDGVGKCLLVNKQWCDFAGLSPEEAKGDGWQQALHPDDRKRISSLWNEYVSEKKPWNFEYRFCTPDRKITWVLGTVIPLTNEQGEITGYLGMNTDITERKQAEEALRESEEKWRKLVQTLPEYVALHDRDGKYLFLNHFAEGFSMKDIEGKTYTHFLADDSKPVFEQAFNTAKQTNSTQYIEYSALGDNRTLRYYESYFVPIFENDEFVNMMVIARDITEHKKAEAEILKSKQQYDNLVSKIPVGVYILRTKPDETYALEYASPKMAEMLGLSVESLLAHHETILKAIHPDDLEDFSRLNINGIRQKQPFDWKGRVLVKGGEKWLHISSRPQQVENGEILWHGLVVDITERMHNEAEIKLKNEELQNLNATKDKFFSIIAHDLRSPFNSILGLTNYMVEQIQEKNFDKLEEYGIIVRNSSQRAMDLLTNLLEWSRSQTGRMEFSPEYVEISSLIGEVTSLLVDSAEQKSITIFQKISGKILASVDRSMFSTILRNLISNAIKFTKVGGTIEISLEEELSTFKVSVKDNGIGIKNEQIEKLFRIDENHSTMGTRNEKGTGLGLILCKEFVDKHGGRIWAESKAGKGSLFCFTIPKY